MLSVLVAVTVVLALAVVVVAIIVAGVLDTLVLYRGRTHWIEIKTPDGELSDPQRSVIAAVTVGGSRVAVARDWIEVLACLDEWQIPRKRRVREAA